MSTPIRRLCLTVKSQNCLKNEGIVTVERAAEFVRDRGMTGLIAIPMLGRASANEILSALCGFLLDHYEPKQPSDHNGPPGPLRDHLGMSLRDHFAAKAMQSLMLDPEFIGDGFDPGEIAERAYWVADAMLAARKDRLCPEKQRN